MARWEVTETPEMIFVAVEHYDKILDEVADLLYRHIRKSQGQWLDPVQNTSSGSGINYVKSCFDFAVSKDGVIRHE